MQRATRLWIGLVLATMTTIGAVATLAVAAKPGSSEGDADELRMVGLPPRHMPGRFVPGGNEAALRMIHRSLGLHAH